MRIFCSICKEIFIPYSEIKATQCGHLYHGSCILRWCKQHKTCPQCRSNLQSDPVRIYFDVEKDNGTDPSTLEHQLETLTDRLRENESTNKNLREKVENYERVVDEMKKCVEVAQEKNDVLKTKVKVLKGKVTDLTKQNDKVSCLEDELKLWKNKFDTLQKVELILKGSADDVTKMLESTPVSQLAVKQLCTYVAILKAQLHKNETKKNELIKEKKDLVKTLAEEKSKNSSESEELIKNLKITNFKLEKELYGLKKLVKENAKKQVDKDTSAISSQNKTQVTEKRPVFDINLDTIFDKTEDKVKKKVRTSDVSRAISKWEDLVCAGPSQILGASVCKSKSFRLNLTNEAKGQEFKCSPLNYTFDGMGGRKKIRLGTPTVQEEFRRIKKSEEKVMAANKHKKIVDYFEIQ